MKNLPQKVRSKKLNSRVDLTAMVSVSFLLIIFFMVVGELSKPKIMDMNFPDRDADYNGRIFGCYNLQRNYTVLLGENDKIITYGGILDSPIIEPLETNYSKNGFRTKLAFYDKQIKELTGDIQKGAIVFIKPSKKKYLRKFSYDSR